MTPPTRTIAWLFALLIPLAIGILLLAAASRRLHTLYQYHFRDSRRERLFLSSISFYVTFAIVRAITHAIRSGVGPFHNVSAGGIHIHHLVWGILLLLSIGYLWLIQVGT